MTKEKDKRCGTLDEGSELYFTDDKGQDHAVEGLQAMFVPIQPPVGYFRHGRGYTIHWHIYNRPNWFFRLFMRFAGWTWHGEP